MKLYSNNIRLAKKIAYGTLISGLIFLLGFYFTYDYSLAIGGAFLGLGVFLIVITILISDLITAKNQHFNSKEKTITILWNVSTLLCIVIFSVIGFILTNTSIIEIKNNSKETIKNVLITGCKDFDINTIDAESSKTIYLFHPNEEEDECTLNINYTTENSIENGILFLDNKTFKGERISYDIN